MKRLSIIIPIFNVETFLKRCLESVLSQDMEQSELEVLLIDDGSTDQSGEIAKNYAERFSYFQYIKQENKGLGGARNTGIENANGRYLLFLDSDDWLENSVLEKITKKAENNLLDLLIFNTQRVFSSGEEKKIDLSYIPEHLYTGEQLILETRVDILPCANLYRKETLDKNKIRFVEGVFYEDPDFYLKFILASQKIIYFPIQVYHYYFNENSITINTGKNHSDKKVYDYAQAGLRIMKLKDGQTKEVQNKLDFLIEKYQLWLMRMMYRSPITYKTSKKIVLSYKERGLFPIKIQQQFVNEEDRIQLFYFNHFMQWRFFFRWRFNFVLLLMKIEKRIKLFKSLKHR